MDNKNTRQKCMCQHKHNVTYKLSNMYKLDKLNLQKHLAATGVHVVGYQHLYQFQALWALYSIDNSNIKPEPEIMKRVCLWVKMSVSQLLALLHENDLDRSGNKWDHLEMLITHHTTCLGLLNRPNSNPTRQRASDNGNIAADVARAARRKARSEKVTTAENARLDEVVVQDAAARQIKLEKKESIRREEKDRLARIVAEDAEKERLRKIAEAEAARLVQAEQDRPAKKAALETARLRETEARKKRSAEEAAERINKTRLAAIALEAVRQEEVETAFQSAFRALAKKITNDTAHMKVLNFALATLLLYLPHIKDLRTLPTWSNRFRVAPHQVMTALDMIKQLDMNLINRLCTARLAPEMGALLWFDSAYGDMFALATGDLHIKGMPREYIQYILAKPLVELQHKFEAGMAKKNPRESITLYHGTNVACVQSIIHEGFRACLYDTVRGPGLYMGAKMETSLRYALQMVHRGGQNAGNAIRNQSHGVLLVCEVVGRGRPLQMQPNFHVIQDLTSVMIRYVILVPYGTSYRPSNYHEPSLIAELDTAIVKIRERQRHGDWQ